MIPVLAAATASAALMALEICGPRLLAPWFGSGTIVWAVLLSCVLVGLSAGNLLGGRLADRAPSPRGVALALLVGAALCAAVRFACDPIARGLSDTLPSTAAGQLAALFAATAILFGLPAVALSAAFPMAMRLALPSVERAGRTYGLLQAASALGSVAGVLVPPLVTVPWIGTRATVLLFAAPAAAVALVALSRPAAAAAALAVLLLACRPGAREDAWESSYAAYRLLDLNGQRTLAVDAGDEPNPGSVPAYSIILAQPGVTRHYFDAFVLAPSMAGTRPRSVLILGFAAGTASHLARHAFPTAEIESVEIDPTLVARFGRPTTHVADARQFVRRARRAYDLVMLDAMVGMTPPPHLVSEEFLRDVRRCLAPGGVVAANVVRPFDADLAATAARVFPHVLRLENVTVASDAPLDPDRMQAEAERIGWPGLAERAVQLRAATWPAPAAPPLTDDRGGPPWWWGLRVKTR